MKLSPRAITKTGKSVNRFFPHAYAAMDIELHTQDSALRQASVLTRGARHAWETGAYTDSQKLNEQALKLKTELLGPEHMDTILSHAGPG